MDTRTPFEYRSTVTSLQADPFIKKLEQEMQAAKGILKQAWIEYQGKKWNPVLVTDRNTGVRGFEWSPEGRRGEKKAVGRHKITLAELIAYAVTGSYDNSARVRCCTNNSDQRNNQFFRDIHFSSELAEFVSAYKAAKPELVAGVANSEIGSGGESGTPVDEEVATYQGDAEKRKIVESYAVEWAIEHYQAQGFSVDEKGKPYDLDCKKGDLLVHIEVKGTTGSGQKVILTSNEVKDAHDPQWRSDLFIVKHIKLTQQDGRWMATSGEHVIHESWKPDFDDLKPLQYEYSVPSIK